MSYFYSRHFMNFIKNKKSIRLINQTNIKRVKTVCSNILENKAIIALKSYNMNKLALPLLGPLSVKTCALELEKVDSCDLLENLATSFIMNVDLIKQDIRTVGNKNSRVTVGLDEKHDLEDIII